MNYVQRWSWESAPVLHYQPKTGRECIQSPLGCQELRTGNSRLQQTISAIPALARRVDDGVEYISEQRFIEYC